MATEVFRKIDFEKALTATCSRLGKQFSRVGLVDGEEHYIIFIKDVKQANTRIFVQVNSTVLRDGLAAATGDNSIRCWLTDAVGNPMGNKVQKYITRVAGWQDRLDVVLDTLVAMGEEIQWCNTCNTMEKVFVVKKDSPNKGRIFVKCECPDSFAWLDTTSDEDKSSKPVIAKPQQVAQLAPKCPRCGSRMAKRVRKSDGHPFWGCTSYPNCKGTVDIPLGDVEEEEWYDVKHEQKVLQAAIAASQPATATKPATFTPSQQNLDIFNWVEKRLGKALVVRARAGCGKSTSCVEIIKRLDRTQRIVYIVFNKHTVEDFKHKCPAYAQVRTANSLGYAAVRKAFPNAIFDEEERKISIILEQVLDKQQFKHLHGIVKQLVSLSQVNLLAHKQGPKGWAVEARDLDQLVAYHNIDLNGDRERIYQTVNLVLTADANQEGLISYDDQIWFPIIKNLPMDKYDVVIGDEAQDFNAAMLELAVRSLKENGLFIAVGDEFQSIYGFRGADCNSIPHIIERMHADVLPLPITYRNPRKVVARVNTRFPYIDFFAAPWAEEGIIRDDVPYTKALTEMVDGDMVLCRCNAPLVAPAMALIRRGVKATIRGRDIGSNLISLIRKVKAVDLVDLVGKLNDYVKEECAKLLAAEKELQAQMLMDKVGTVLALADGENTISGLEDKIEDIFSDHVDGVVFSSIHKAKGLEAKRVFILKPELMPHPAAKQPWELEQERNMEYVALTRTLHELVYVTGGPK